MLNDDAAQVHDELQRAGASAAMIRRLMVAAARLPAIWMAMNRETAPQRRKRREALAKKALKLAAQVERDPEWRAARLDGHDAVLFANSNNRPLLADWLRDLAETITTRHDSLPRLDRKQDLRSFVLVQVRDMLDQDFPPSRSRNQQAEIIASAVINDPIPPGTLAQIRKRS